MGSIFAQMPSNVKAEGFLGSSVDVPFYLQFVPGNVIHVVTSTNSQRYVGASSINSIIALPHLSEDSLLRRSSISEKYRYFPLFRGMVDVPVKGDPVLLCTIGGVNYYLGPINTNNHPNWNGDNLDKLDSVGVHNKLLFPNARGPNSAFPFIIGTTSPLTIL